MPKAKVFWEPPDTLRFALGEIKGPGLALEFGVATGGTLKIIAEPWPLLTAPSSGSTCSPVCPKPGAPAFRQGSSRRNHRHVAGATVVPGLFEDTLPKFLADNDEPIAFVHVDCDLYSSSKTVLDLVADRLAPDAVLVFDEFFNYPGWRQHEYRAWTEFIVARQDVHSNISAYTGNNEQVVVRLLH